MNYRTMDLEQLEQAFPPLLERCGISSYIDLPTIKQWFLESSSPPELAYIPMIMGIVPVERIEDSALMSELVEAMMRLQQLLFSWDKEVSDPQELHLTVKEVELPPTGWEEPYWDALEHMREGNFFDAAERFEDAFTYMLEKATTNPDLYRLYANAGLAFLLSGSPHLGVFCLRFARELNPKYQFAVDTLDRYDAGNYNDLIKAGILQRMMKGVERFQEEKEEMSLQEVEGWSEEKILRHLEPYGIAVDKARYIELARNVHRADGLIEELFTPSGDIDGLNEDFPWMAAYALWNIYCPEEPSLTNFEQLLREAYETVEDIVEEANGSIESEVDSHLLGRLDEFLDGIHSFVFTPKEGFLEYWDGTFEYRSHGQHHLRTFLLMVGAIEPFRERASSIAKRLYAIIPHPVWLIVQASIALHAGDEDWERSYQRYRDEYPYYCYGAVDLAMMFARLDDRERCEHYLHEALAIVDRRAEEGVLDSEESETTILNDYKYVLERIASFSGFLGMDASDRERLEKKGAEVLEQEEVYSHSPRGAEIQQKANKLMNEFEIEKAERSSAKLYADLIAGLGIDFSTSGEVESQISEFRLGKEQIEERFSSGSKSDERSSPRRRRRSRSASKEQRAGRKRRRGDKKVGRNDPCPCGSGKKYKRCCHPLARHQ